MDRGRRHEKPGPLRIACQRGGIAAPESVGPSPLSTTIESEYYPRLTSGRPGQTALTYYRLDVDAPWRITRSFLRLLDHCETAGCSVVPRAPAPGAAIAQTDQPPVFWWEPGSGRKFRVEFSAAPDFSKRLTSQSALKVITGYLPPVAKWKKVAKLAPQEARSTGE
jgi:hypothetical protein